MKNQFYAIVVLAILSGLLIPQFAVISPAIPYLIVILLYLSFMNIELDWKRFFRKELFLTLFLSAAFIPLLSYYVFSQGLHPDYRIGLFLTGIAPSGIMTLIVSAFLKHKDYELIMSNFITTTFGTILYLPPMLKLVVGTSVEIKIFDLFLQTAAIILTPFIFAEITRRITSMQFCNKINEFGKKITLVIVFLIIASSIGLSVVDITWDWSLLRLSLIVTVIYLLQGTIAYFGGFIFGGGKAVRHSLALVASSRNIQLLMGIAIINFGPLVLVPLVLGIIIHHATNAFWLWLFRN